MRWYVVDGFDSRWIARCVAVCCSVLPCVAVCSTPVGWLDGFRAVCCSALQYVVECCSALQCGAVTNSPPLDSKKVFVRLSMSWWSMLQCGVAVCCSAVLQYVAVRCSAV